MSKKLFILSTKAGEGEFVQLEKDIINTYKNHNREDEIEIVKTKYKDHSIDLARDFSKKDYKDKIIIVCGGDGSLSEVSNTLVNTNTALGLIPMGTGNDFSKNFNYKNFKIEDTFEPKVLPIDMIKVNKKYCINVMSLGFDTQVLEKTYEILEQEPNLGNKAFLKGIVKSLKNIKYENLELDLVLKDNTKINVKDEYIVSALCNGSYYGSGFNPSPKGKIDDGILNLIAVKKLPLYKVIPILLLYKTGKHMGLKSVTEYLVKSGVIKSNKEIIANIDGEIFRSKEFEFEILKNSLKWAYFNY